MSIENFSITWLYYLFPVALVILYSLYTSKRHRAASDILEQNQRDGLLEPVSLHPVFDEVKCLGCRSCISACPEKHNKVIGVVNNKAHLINPSHCIGHGACQKACPFDAITLVFGTATRGVDIPFVSETFETNVPGIFIAGELGGMGLIRNAVEQGRQAMDAISKSLPKKSHPDHVDVVIVGAGPSGLAATLAAKQHKLNYVTLEQDSLGGTVFQFPRGKVVMTAPVNMPLVGKLNFRETSKENLLKTWQDIEQKTGIDINYQERVDRIEQSGHSFLVTTPSQQYQTSSILLCIGRRGTPRKLDVPGEELPKVVYRLIDPEQYLNQKVLVVGGGDSALEAALSIAEQPGTQVTLSYRSGSFSRAKEKNRNRIMEAGEKGQIKIIFNSNVTRIEPDRVILKVGEKQGSLKNDAVIISAGGILPTDFLKKIGIEVTTHYGTA